MDKSELVRVTGLKESEIELIQGIVFSINSIEDAILYGSRAKGCHKRFSDIDLSLIGDNITHGDLVDLMMKFEDSSLPYTVDINRYSTLTNPDLTDHITRVGISLKEV